MRKPERIAVKVMLVMLIMLFGAACTNEGADEQGADANQEQKNEEQGNQEGSGQVPSEQAQPDAFILQHGIVQVSNDNGLDAIPFYKNPVVSKNAPDPSVLKASDGMYYMYPTGGNKFKVYSSPDLIHWKDEGNAIHTDNVKWAGRAFWAPHVIEYEGKFYMFYSALKEGKDDEKGMTVAVSDTPTGPFVDADEPVFDLGFPMTIDPYVFVDDDGRVYMYFTVALTQYEGYTHRESRIYVVELEKDLMSLKSEPVMLTRPDQAWEISGNQRWNEGVVVLKHNDLYYMMYSANCYCNKNYAVGYAVSESPMGPFEKHAKNPILRAFYEGVSGTGHHSVVSSPDGSELLMLYHAHINGIPGGNRWMQMDRIGFREDGTLYVSGPTMTAQPVPGGVSEWINIAGDADVTASSVKDDSRADAVIDGEVGVDGNFANYDWTTDKGDTEGAWIELSWDAPREVNSIWIYDSGYFRKQVMAGRLILNDQSVLEIDMPVGNPGEAAVVALNGAKIEKVRFEITETIGGAVETGLSEIVVLGK